MTGDTPRTRLVIVKPSATEFSPSPLLRALICEPTAHGPFMVSAPGARPREALQVLYAARMLRVCCWRAIFVYPCLPMRATQGAGLDAPTQVGRVTAFGGEGRR